MDSSTPLAHSAAIKLELPGMGQVRVAGKRLRRTHRSDPPKLTFLSARLVMSHVCFDVVHPQRITSVLGLALRGLAVRRGLRPVASDLATVQAIADLRNANLVLLKQLETVCHSLRKYTPLRRWWRRQRSAKA